MREGDGGEESRQWGQWNRYVRALSQKWVVQLKEAEVTGTIGPYYKMRLEGSKLHFRTCRLRFWFWSFSCEQWKALKCFKEGFGRRWQDDIFNSERSFWLQYGGWIGKRTSILRSQLGCRLGWILIDWNMISNRKLHAPSCQNQLPEFIGF